MGLPGLEWTSEMFVKLFDSILSTVFLPLPENSTLHGGVATTLPTILQPCQSPTTTHLRINTITVSTHLALQHLSSNTYRADLPCSYALITPVK